MFVYRYSPDTGAIISEAISLAMCAVAIFQPEKLPNHYPSAVRLDPQVVRIVNGQPIPKD